MKPKKDLSYYLTLFKIKGHSTWRAHLSGYADGFLKNIDINIVTDKKVIRVDRLAGTLHNKKETK